MSNFKPNSKLADATQRWKASGLARQTPFRERIAMLDAIMRRSDLIGAEIRICYYLMITRTNAETGLCCASDKNIADALGINKRTVERAKQALKAKGILDWETTRLGNQNQLCLYRFNKEGSCGTYTGTKHDNQTGINDNQTGTRHDNQTGTKYDNQTGTRHDNQTGTAKIRIPFASQERDAWERWSQQTGRPLPNGGRSGDIYMPTRWPPHRELTLAESFDL